MISSYCNFGDCVHVTHERGLVLVRHSSADTPVLVFLPDEWAAFLKGVKAGEFDGPTEDAA